MFFTLSLVHRWNLGFLSWVLVGKPWDFILSFSMNPLLFLYFVAKYEWMKLNNMSEYPCVFKKFRLWDLLIINYILVMFSYYRTSFPLILYNKIIYLQNLANLILILAFWWVMEKCKFFFVLYFLLAIQFSHKVEAFYVPGVAPVEFDKGEPVEIKVSPYFVFIFIIISRHAYEVSEAGFLFWSIFYSYYYSRK